MSVSEAIDVLLHAKGASLIADHTVRFAGATVDVQVPERQGRDASAALFCSSLVEDAYGIRTRLTFYLHLQRNGFDQGLQTGLEVLTLLASAGDAACMVNGETPLFVKRGGRLVVAPYYLEMLNEDLLVAFGDFEIESLPIL